MHVGNLFTVQQLHRQPLPKFRVAWPLSYSHSHTLFISGPPTSSPFEGVGLHNYSALEAPAGKRGVPVADPARRSDALLKILRVAASFTPVVIPLSTDHAHQARDANNHSQERQPDSHPHPWSARYPIQDASDNEEHEGSSHPADAVWSIWLAHTSS